MFHMAGNAHTPGLLLDRKGIPDLGAGQPVLVILDNFPEDESLRPWLPVSGAIHTLVTTRRRDLSGYERLKLGFLDERDSIELLNRGDRTFGHKKLERHGYRAQRDDN